MGRPRRRCIKARPCSGVNSEPEPVEVITMSARWASDASAAKGSVSACVRGPRKASAMRAARSGRAIGDQQRRCPVLGSGAGSPAPTFCRRPPAARACPLASRRSSAPGRPQPEATDTEDEPMSVSVLTFLATVNADCSSAGRASSQPPRPPSRRYTTPFTWPRICGSPTTIESSDEATRNRCRTASRSRYSSQVRPQRRRGHGQSSRSEIQAGRSAARRAPVRSETLPGCTSTG